MSDPVFNAVEFREKFPAFADATKYPDELLSGYFDMAKCFVWPHEWCLLHGDCLQNAMDLMTAHIAFSQTMINNGQSVPGIMVGATIDKVSVSVSPPPTSNGWQYWLATTPYGMMLWALLIGKASGGFYVGGSPERRGFRKIGGFFR